MKPVLTYVSLFSGIEACSVAMSRITEIDWQPVFFSEIDPFPCAVLAHRFPSVPNLGDVCKIRVEERTNPETNETEKVITNGSATLAFPRMGIDILAGGSPCQGFSVAGRRLGSADERSGLVREYARLVDELKPRLLLWENVPGCFSTNGGHDFGDFLDSLGQLGYEDLSWRVLDAQYTVVDESFPRGIPQRRRRIWLVGVRTLGCPRAEFSVSSQILALGESNGGDTPPRRETGKGFAAPAGYCSRGGDRVPEGGTGGGMAYSVGNGQLNQTAPESVAKTLDTMHDAQMAVTSSASFDGADVSATLHRPNGSPGFSDQEIFSQGGGVPRKNGDEIVSIAKEGYNAGSAQNGSLGIGTDGAAPCIRADDHPTAIGMNAEPGYYGETYPVEIAPPPHREA